MIRKLILLTVGLGFALPGVADHHGHAPIQITEWPVPWERSRPRDPAVAADGTVWFVGQAGHYVASFDPETEQFRRYDLDNGTGPHTVIVTRDQEIWYAGNRASHIGRLDPETGEIHKVMTPEDVARDPHTLDEDATGRLWFTSQQANSIGRYNRETGELEFVQVPTPRARPYGLKVDEDDNAWVVLLGTNKLARIDGETLALTEIDLPRPETRPRRIALAHGQVWYVDYAAGYLGAYNPETGAIREWRAPGADMSGPYAMEVDQHGRIWFVETHPEVNQFVGFDPATEAFFATAPVPSGGGSVRHMWFDAATNTIWFGTDTNNLGRAVIR